MQKLVAGQIFAQPYALQKLTLKPSVYKEASNTHHFLSSLVPRPSASSEFYARPLTQRSRINARGGEPGNEATEKVVCVRGFLVNRAIHLAATIL